MKVGTQVLKMHGAQAQAEHACMSDRISERGVLVDHRAKKCVGVELTEKSNFSYLPKTMTCR